MRVNGINDPRKLKEGQVLTINQGNTRQYAAVGGGVYTVQKGDTLYGISRELKIPVNKLREINRGLKDVIRPGQTINY